MLRGEIVGPSPSQVVYANTRYLAAWHSAVIDTMEDVRPCEKSIALSRGFEMEAILALRSATHSFLARATA